MSDFVNLVRSRGFSIKAYGVGQRVLITGACDTCHKTVRDAGLSIEAWLVRFYCAMRGPYASGLSISFWHPVPA